MRYQASTIPCCLVYAVSGDELVFRSDLHIVSRLELPVSHVIIFHTHEGGIFVGLGKTVEAGLILSELLLRRRIQRVLVLTPASLRLQWRDEMWDKFSLSFDLGLAPAGAQDTVPLTQRWGRRYGAPGRADERLFRAADGLFRCVERHDDRARRDLRAGIVDNPLRRRGPGGRDRQ